MTKFLIVHGFEHVDFVDGLLGLGGVFLVDFAKQPVDIDDAVRQFRFRSLSNCGAKCDDFAVALRDGAESADVFALLRLIQLIIEEELLASVRNECALHSPQ